jgi:hypothetical protein
VSNDHAAKFAIGGLVVARRFRNVSRGRIPMPATIGRFSAGIAFACHTATMSRMAGTERTPSPRSAVKLTYDDFVLFPDDGKRHEIIDGEHYVTPSPSVRHQLLIGRLHFEIESWVRQHSCAGQVFLSPLDVLFTRWDIVEPDLLFVTPDQEEILTDKNVQGPTALVIEVASPGTRKRDDEIQTAALRSRWSAGILARRSRARSHHCLAAPGGWLFPTRRRVVRRTARRAHHAAAGRAEDSVSPVVFLSSTAFSHRRRAQALACAVTTTRRVKPPRYVEPRTVLTT